MYFHVYIYSINMDPKFITKLDLFIAENVNQVPEEYKLREYIDQLSPLEKKAMIIAYEHLETSFDLLKSNGYINWIKTYPQS